MENSDILKGMYTSPDRAQVLNELFAYVEEQELKGQEIILYGGIPALSYYLEMPFAITAWPDLKSYHYAVLEGDLELLSAQIAQGEKDAPVILLEAGCLDLKKAKDPKFDLLMDWAGQYPYEITFENEKFVMLQMK